MVNKFDLADEINDLIKAFPQLDEYRQKFSKLDQNDELPPIQCLKRRIPWGADAD